jgi:predicted transcriptional regulator
MKENAMTRDVTISFRIAPEVVEQLDALSESTDRPRSWHLEQALSAYLDTQSWQVAHIRQGMAEIAAGQGVAHDRVKDWVESWENDHERGPPA